MPVAVTTIAAVPRVTAVFWNSMFERSPSATSGPASTPASFATGALSPVSAASCVSSVAEWTIRPSAGTMSPASTWTMSPGTMSTAGTSATRAVAHDLRLRHLQVRERVDARPRLQLLPRAEHDVEQDQQRDDDAGGDLADHEAHRDDRDQHDVHRVAQLLRRDRPHRRRLLLADLVRPVPREPRRRLRAGQAGVRVRPQRRPRRSAGVAGIRGVHRRTIGCRLCRHYGPDRTRLRPTAPIGNAEISTRRHSAVSSACEIDRPAKHRSPMVTTICPARRQRRKHPTHPSRIRPARTTHLRRRPVRGRPAWPHGLARRILDAPPCGLPGSGCRRPIPSDSNTGGRLEPPTSCLCAHEEDDRFLLDRLRLGTAVTIVTGSAGEQAGRGRPGKLRRHRLPEQCEEGGAEVERVDRWSSPAAAIDGPQPRAIRPASDACP